jgi:hypothetical protein
MQIWRNSGASMPNSRTYDIGKAALRKEAGRSQAQHRGGAEQGDARAAMRDSAVHPTGSLPCSWFVLTCGLSKVNEQIWLRESVRTGTTARLRGYTFGFPRQAGGWQPQTSPHSVHLFPRCPLELSACG